MVNNIDFLTGLIIAFILFGIGFTGLMIRRNVIFMLMSIEIMLNAAGLAFVFAGSYWNEADGQVMFVFILAVTAAEVSIGLALIILMYQKFVTLDIDELKRMNG